MSREYATTITCNRDELRKMKVAQAAVFDRFTGNFDDDDLSIALSAISTVLSLLFKLPLPYQVVGCVSGLLSGLLGASEKEIVQKQLLTGYMSMGKIQEFLDANSQYDLIEIKFPFLEYYVDSKNIRMVNGNGLVTKVHVRGSGWEILN